MKQEADAEGYEEFVVPDDVGGRFSVMSAVGLLPIAVAGGDIDEMMRGLGDGRKAYASADLKENEAYQYAALRNILYRKGYTTELLENYEPTLQYLGEWWKQLMGESEGKDQKGIYPSSANFSTDLHSLGQYIQEGLRKAYEGVVLAHTDGGVPVMTVSIPKQDAYTLGYLIYFFEAAVSISGYLNGINPFNQPGVEAYKKNMFALLGRPGYEDMTKELNARL